MKVREAHKILASRMSLEDLEYIDAVATMEVMLHSYEALLKKDTPMKPLYKIPDYRLRKDGEELPHCPICEWQLNWKYGCQNNKCRQCIDWSDEE